METAHVPKQWIRWIQMMMRGDRDSATQYDLRGNVALTRTDAGIPTMNFGYWRDVAPTAKDALWAATQALFQLVGETAALSDRDAMVLDAGCGFGTNARYLAETFGVQRVVGLNVSSLQLAACRQIARGSARAAAINFARGSATCMPFADATFDKVVSVEAAFHFPPAGSFLPRRSVSFAPEVRWRWSIWWGRPRRAPGSAPRSRCCVGPCRSRTKTSMTWTCIVNS